MNFSAQQTYRNTQVTTVLPGDLTLMLYNGCIRFMKQARLAMQDKQYEEKNTNIKKAKNIVDELMITLNMEYPISGQLLQLYEFINRMLMESNINNNIEKLDFCLEFVTELRDTWIQAMKSLKSTDKVGTK